MPTPAKPAIEPLDAETTALLASFARAVKGAVRAVALYPADHPAIQSSLERMVEVAASATSRGMLYLSIVPDNLLIDGRPPARPDAGVTELAGLLHQHLVGELVIQPGTDLDSWRRFVGVLAGSPADVQAQGGIARVWATTAGGPIEVREIDYAEVLKERAAGDEASWDRIISNCLAGDAVELDEDTLKSLLEIAADAERLGDLVERLEQRAGPRGAVRMQATALLRVLRSLARYVSRTDPGRLDTILGNMATAASKVSPDVMLEIIAQRKKPEGETTGLDVIEQVLSRIGDPMVAQFVARSVISDHGATVRLAEAFQALVPDETRRESVLELVKQQLGSSPLGATRDFERLWSRVEEMLASYSDRAYVTEAYNRELTAARGQAMEIERLSDDPPERVAAWVSTVSDAYVRTLDLQLLLDLLEVEQDPFHWRNLIAFVVPHIEDVVLIGDFEAALRLVTVLARVSGEEHKVVRRAAASAAIERLAEGDLLDNIATHLQDVSDEDLETVKELCRAMGTILIGPLAELLSLEQRVRVRHRLTELLLNYGAAGRESVERLMSSPNASVRRTAVYLLRDFGGSGALPELERLLNDKEPHVQREAVRALLKLNSDEAFGVLEKTLAAGNERARSTIMRELTSLTDERAVPLFCYIVQHTDSRGAMEDVYLKAIERLGTLGGHEAIAALKQVLYRGRWWAPLRTKALRAAAATSLRRVGTAEALDVLNEAVARGPWGVRAVVRGAANRDAWR
jgi:HEAT repeat protein